MPLIYFDLVLGSQGKGRTTQIPTVSGHLTASARLAHRRNFFRANFIDDPDFARTAKRVLVLT